MRTRSIALGVTLALAAAGATGCGGSDDEETTTSAAADAPAATVPDGKLNASTAPPRLGYYAGVDCGKLSDSDCEDVEAVSKEGWQTFCRGGKAHPSSLESFTWRRKDKPTVEVNYFCFTLKDKQTAANFIYAGPTIVKSVHVSTDRFPRTEEAGWGVQGEWFTTRIVRGKVNNPNGVTSSWRASHIGDLS